MTAELHLDETLPSGGTRRAHLEQIARSGGTRSPKLTPPPLDPDGEALRRLFAELSGLRQSNGYGVEPLRPGDVLAWGEVTGNRLDPWQWQALARIDAAFREELNRQADERSSKGPKA